MGGCLCCPWPILLWPAVTQVAYGDSGANHGERDRVWPPGPGPGTQPCMFWDLLIACVTSYGDDGIGTTRMTEPSGTCSRQVSWRWRVRVPVWA